MLRGLRIALFLGGAAFVLSMLLPPTVSSVKSYGEAQIGGSFSLINTDSALVRDTDFRGHPMLVYFGFTHCPDICPASLTTVSETLKILGADASNVAVLFITIDPTRDTPNVLKKYLEQFDHHIIGLTGSPQDIQNLAKAYRLYAKKAPGSDASHYAIDHSGLVYLMDKDGKYVTHFDPDAKASDIAAKVRQLTP